LNPYMIMDFLSHIVSSLLVSWPPISMFGTIDFILMPKSN
jgi:hypothetical protein